MNSTKLEKILKKALHYHRKGELQQAETLYKRLLRYRPAHPEALHLLGVIANQSGNYDRSEKLLQQAIEAQPNNAVYHYNYGNTLKIIGKTNEALQEYRQAVTLKAEFPLAHNNLGNLLSDLGRPADAIPHYQQALRYNPGYAEAYNNLGNSLKDLGKLEAALDNFQKAFALQPDNADILMNLGNILKDLDRSREAVHYLQKTIDLSPQSTVAHYNLATVLGETGQTARAITHFRTALQIDPNNTDARSNLLFLLSYNVLCSPQEMLAAHQEWDHAHGGGPERARTFRHEHNDDPERHLRIGYVSPDFRHHAVSYFFEPLLKAHDCQQVEVFCYAEVIHPDTVTRRLQAQADHWRSTVDLSDEAMARQIFDDGIDILIDLAGHTAGNRLKAFSYKPAPVQASYLGYFTTTGLAAMDYWITDEVLTPRDTVELTTETIYRLPRCCLVYQAAADAPDVMQPDHEHVTFGSFNQARKISSATVALWSAVLQAVPQSQLLLKSKRLADTAVQTKVRQQFATHGIDSKRLILLSATASYREHLATYGQVDIALDTIPRTGGSTTADALWMGVPVITLAGERFIERLSATMLSAVGLQELITPSREDYVACALALAQDHNRRNTLRSSLRQRMADSPLCDATDLARALEHAYRQMWRQFLSTTA